MEIHAEPQLVVPALVKSLSDTNYSVRMLATIGLGYFGTNAQQAVPALVPMLSDPDLDIRRTAAYDLEAIDPGAAAKAGVK
jgi:HEAT repeat protein